MRQERSYTTTTIPAGFPNYHTYCILLQSKHELFPKFTSKIYFMFYMCPSTFGFMDQTEKKAAYFVQSLVFAFCLWVKQIWSSACSGSLLSDCHYFGLLFKPYCMGKRLTSLSSSLGLIGPTAHESEPQSSFL